MNAPTLIVGLGGKGSEIVLRVSKMVNEEQRQKIGFVVFDTDVNELRNIKINNPHVHTIQTSMKMTVGEYLEMDEHAKDTWFPVNAVLNNKMLTEGAGQVRAISRLAFDTAIRNGKLEELHKAIGELYELEGEDFAQALRVIIVSTIAGGTGSGLIVPVGLYIKNYLATHYRQGANITRGFFLLPEILYGVITSQEERNNLKSNAYATLREIDAFLMKGDSTLPSRYENSIHLEFPGVVSDEYEEYDVRPYDFCFLFDGQNADGKTLSSFDEYLDHAANCIYAQSIGPMNKRSNSSEDNTIRKLVAEKGRNRYCGAGTSLLTYPTADVKKYLALNWAKECVSEAWLLFDKELRDKKRLSAKKRESVGNEADIKRESDYVTSVETKAAEKNRFAMSILDACIEYSDDGKPIGNNWDAYLDALSRKIKTDMETSVSNMKARSIRQDADEALEDIKGAPNPDKAWAEFPKAYEKMKAYYFQSRKQSEMLADNIAYSLFHPDTDAASSLKEDFYLEKHLRDSHNHFIHPCAIRYFLYNVLAALDEEHNRVCKKWKENEAKIDSFEKNTFGGEEGSTATVYNLRRKSKDSLLDLIRKKSDDSLSKTVNEFGEYLAWVDELSKNIVLSKIYEQGMEYVESVAKGYESFFDSLNTRISHISAEMKGIETKYSDTKGHASRYVCASKDCLETMSKLMPFMGSVMDLDPKLCELIYDRVRAYNLLTVATDSDDYFKEIFDKDIIGFFEKELMESYGQDVNMDIITAIEKEAEYGFDIVNENDVRKYVIDVIDSAKILAAPFIEKPMGDEKNPINACAYNPKLKPDDHSPRARLIEQELKNFGGTADDDIPINQILFYKSFYGLRANELSKFAPPQKGETFNRSGGEYFKAYYELVGKISPDPTKTKAVTPHIDKNWHIITNMPDLDDSNQELQLSRIYSSFFWGFADGFIDLPVEASKKSYRIKKRMNGVDKNIALTVSNKTSCDRLFEVLDALANCNELVEGILDTVNTEIEKELNDGKGSLNNDLIEGCFNVRIPQVSDTKETPDPISIFEIPFVLKNSMKSDQGREEDDLRMVDTILAETQKVIKRFCRESELGDPLFCFYDRQLDMMLENIKKYGKKASYCSDFLFMSMCSSIVETFEDLDMRKEAKEINKKIERFRQE